MKTASPERATFSILIPFLGAIAALGPLSNDLYVPSMSLVADGLGVSGAAVQLTMSSLLIGFSFGALIYGPLSDRFGRKNVLLVGLGMYAVAGALAALSPTLGWLVLARALQGFAASCGMVLSRAIILDRWRGEEASRALSWVSIFMFFTPVLAPLVGGYISGFGYWPAIFWMQGSAGLLCLLVTLFMLPRARRGVAGSVLASIRAYGPIVKDTQALGYMLCSALGFIGVVAFVSTASFVFVDYYGLTPQQFGLSFSTVMLGGSIGAYLNSHYVAQVGISRMLAFGSTTLAIGGVLVLLSSAFGGGVIGLVLAFMLYVFGIGAVFANTVARTLSRYPQSLGAASSLFGVNQFFIGGVVAALLSRVTEPSPMPMAWVVAASGLACAGVWWLWLKPASAKLHDGPRKDASSTGASAAEAARPAPPPDGLG
ncbi:MAG: multidrug effflux MFS transporter [Gammaproteobacteria bacterium]|nr:multidrug effflux MFS transporter [Gammaproteobacteria bacterium]